MNVTRNIDDIRRLVADARAAGQSIALVPTMGAIHEGHCSLIRAAKDACDFVVVSIFVNPTQFGPDEDFQKYPRMEDSDLASCERCGVDTVFAPSVEVMYGEESLTEVSVGRLGKTLCGASRPGHFAGVCTVVAKLFNIVLPDAAFFGAKDFQQAVIIRRMTDDLKFPVRIVICPTARQGDGLAISSRNSYLTPAQRKQATGLYGALQMADEKIRSQHPCASDVIEAIRAHLNAHVPQGQIDYIQIVNPKDLRDVGSTDRAVLVALAVQIGGTRLIDNTLVDGP